MIDYSYYHLPISRRLPSLPTPDKPTSKPSCPSSPSISISCQIKINVTTRNALEEKRRVVRGNGVFFVTSYRGGLGYRGRRRKETTTKRIAEHKSSSLWYNNEEDGDVCVPSPSNAKILPFY